MGDLMRFFIFTWFLSLSLTSAAIAQSDPAPVSPAVTIDDDARPDAPGAGQASPADVLGQVQAQMPDRPPATGSGPPLAPIGVLVLNQERFLSQSLYGQRIQRELELASTALASENRLIESRLSAEELDLTEVRATMPPADFRVLAEEFDTRVEGIRAAQEAKTRALQTQADAAQSQFFELAFPILLDIVQTSGAQVLMDNRAVLLSSEGVDITDIALDRVNAEVGEGGSAPLIDLSGIPQPDISAPQSDR